MLKHGIRWFTAVVTCTVLTGLPEDASAGWHHRRHGSSGSWGSSGSSGSSGYWGSSGSSGSSGSWGSSGSGGSWGGSSGFNGSSGGWGSSGSSGAWGGPAYYSPATPYVPAVPATPVSPESPPAPATTMRVTPATVVINVPEDATVYFAGRKMVTQGTTRRYLVPVQKAGATYEYPIKVEVTRNGSKLVSETKHRVRSGQTVELTMTESNSSDVISVVQR